MNWLNLNINDILSSPEFLGETYKNNGIWLRLMKHCAKLENKGVLKDAKKWNDENWLFIAGVGKDVISNGCKLWTWKGDDLHVWGYSLKQEIATQAKRKGGQATKPRSIANRPESAVSKDTEIIKAAQEIRSLHPKPGLLKEDQCAIIEAIQYEVSQGCSKENAIKFIKQATIDYANSKDEFKYGARKWFDNRNYQSQASKPVEQKVDYEQAEEDYLNSL